MKNILKLLFIAIVLMAFASCKKVADLPSYSLGTKGTLAASATLITPLTADSDKAALTLSWTNPKYATADANVKYVVEIDSAGKNFVSPFTKTITGATNLSTTFTGKDINTFLLSRGYAYNVPISLDVRVTSSYANNNDKFSTDIIRIKFTTYVVPPKVTFPTSKTLFIIGDATASGWNYNPVADPAQKFTRLDSVTYEGTFFLNGGKQYLLLPNGNWNTKYAVQNNSITGLSAGGSFGYNSGSGSVFNDNFPAPAKTGMYKIRVDFQNGIFTVTPVGTYGLLYVPGDYQGWDPAKAPSLGSPKNDGSYDGYVNIPAGGSNQFKFTPLPDWSSSYGDFASNGTSGVLVLGGNNNLAVPGPGYYHIVANTNTKTWSATKTTWSMIGSFAASNWSNDIDMVYSAANNNWTGTITTAAGDQFKFRANHDWGLNYGPSGATGSLVLNGDNIGDASKNFAIPAGTHTVILFLNNSGYYTYLIQ
jgi:hypothetical protein